MPETDPQQVIEDLRRGMSYAEMMEKYQLTFDALNGLFQRLVSEGRLSTSEVQKRASVEQTQQFKILKCQSCGKLVFDESETCPACSGPLGLLKDQAT
jgi:rubrerythrin